MTGVSRERVRSTTAAADTQTATQAHERKEREQSATTTFLSAHVAHGMSVIARHYM